MSLLQLISWADIVLGMCGCAVFLSRLTVGRSRPEMAERGARSDTWQRLCISLALIVTGFILAGWWKHYSWLVGICWIALAVWGFGRPRRRRFGRRPDNRTAEPG